MMVASAIMLGLFTALFLLCQQSTIAMIKGTTQSGMLSDMQVLGRRLERAVQGSVAASLTISTDGSGASWLSAEDEEGRFHFDPVLSQPRWQKYLVFYYLPDKRSLALAEVPVVGSNQERIPGPIETFGPAHPVEQYFHDGRQLLAGVDAATFSRPAPSSVGLSLSVSKPRGSELAAERSSMTVMVTFRN